MTTREKRKEIFDRVEKHLLAQNSKSLSCEEPDNMCMYRGEDGKMCAVGCLISDDNYSHELEGRPVCDPVVMGALEHSGVPSDVDTGVMLEELQRVHDKHPVPNWRG